MTRSLHPILLIERRRILACVKVSALCAAAPYDERGYRRQISAARDGRELNLHRRSLDRLDAALSRLLEGRKKPPPDPIISGFYRLAMRTLAQLEGLDSDAVCATDFSVQRPKNRDWLTAARIRRFAIYLTVVEFDISGATMARAIECSPPNVSQALIQVEELREDPKIDELLDCCARMAKGAGQ